MKKIRAAVVGVVASALLLTLAGVSEAAAEPVIAKGNPQKVQPCNRKFKHSVSTVTMDRTPGGSLRWGFKLTPQARKKLGLLVTVTMTDAYVNSYKINPPYGPHTKKSTYDFHASMKNYQRKGKKWKGRNFTLKYKDEITFLWLIKSISHPKSGAYRTVTCTFPKN